MTFDFTSIVDWKLLPGSHDFPGPDGGTCISEAAIVAAGFEYRKVRSATDCPPCFSVPLSAYLIGLNDKMPDGERQKLVRFILRLSGSADTREIEQSRVELIVLRAVQRLLPPILEAQGFGGLSAFAAAAAISGVWDICIEIAEEAFAIGKQATNDDAALVETRMRAARGLVAA